MLHAHLRLMVCHCASCAATNANEEDGSFTSSVAADADNIEECAHGEFHDFVSILWIGKAPVFPVKR